LNLLSHLQTKHLAKYDVAVKARKQQQKEKKGKTAQATVQAPWAFKNHSPERGSTVRS